MDGGRSAAGSEGVARHRGSFLVKIELPPAVAAQLAGPLADCYRGEGSPDCLAGQVVRGSFDDGGVDKIFLFLARIKPETARKIRKVIQRERETLAKKTSNAA